MLAQNSTTESREKYPDASWQDLMQKCYDEGIGLSAKALCVKLCISVWSCKFVGRLGNKTNPLSVHSPTKVFCYVKSRPPYHHGRRKRARVQVPYREKRKIHII